MPFPQGDLHIRRLLSGCRQLGLPGREAGLLNSAGGVEEVFQKGTDDDGRDGGSW
jgi:hypothetical protein